MSTTNGNGKLDLDRACLYLRRSTDDQAQSIDRQRGQTTAYAAARGYRVIREYTDEGIAGDVFDRRPDFQEMLAAAGRGEFEVIVVDEPSRLSRQNPIDLIEKVIAPLRRCASASTPPPRGHGLRVAGRHYHDDGPRPQVGGRVPDLSRRSLGGVAGRRQPASGSAGYRPSVCGSSARRTPPPPR